jgi:hypothetical protein
MCSALPSTNQEYDHATSRRHPTCSPEVLYLPEGVMFVRWPADAKIAEPDAWATISRVEELSGDGPGPMLVDMHGMRSASSAALNRFARYLPTTRVALVGTSPVEQTIAQFFRDFHQPSYPASYFTQDVKALEWLGDCGTK